MAGDSVNTALVGVIGEGEEDRPPHPQRDALARLLLERGAEPYDIQVIYNTHFHGDVLCFLTLIHEHSVRAGRQADWTDPEWSMLDMGNYGSGARFLLGGAVQANNLELAEWILSHGANPNAAPSHDPRLSKRSLYEEAVRSGYTDLGALLVRYGARATDVLLSGIEAFEAVCFRLDGDAARAMIDRHPAYLLDPMPLHAAAARNRADVAALLLDLGVNPEIEDSTQGNQRALHAAAYAGSIEVAALLVARGAEIDPRASNWGNTPLGAAVYSDRQRMIELLARYSRDVWALTYSGKIARLREVLREEPEKAKIESTGNTPLMWLPDDPTAAMGAAMLLLTCGADPSIRNSEGQTAADIARKRGLHDVAELLASD